MKYHLYDDDEDEESESHMLNSLYKHELEKEVNYKMDL
jgi:hypothetical protein